jgi:hypothetical protein
MEVTGQLKAKFDTQTVSDKFKKRDFVLATDLNTPYPQFVSFQVTQDKCSVLDSYNVGDEVKVSFNLRGREYNNPTKGLQYFNTLEAWRIEKLASGSIATNNESVPQITPLDNDDLPF